MTKQLAPWFQGGLELNSLVDLTRDKVFETASLGEEIDQHWKKWANQEELTLQVY